MRCRIAVGGDYCSSSARPGFLSFLRQTGLSPQNAPRQNGHRSTLLILLAGCLVAGLGVPFVFQAFGGDPDLCPFGAEDFIVAAQCQSLPRAQLIGGVSALSPLLSALMTAGAYLVLRHRARSALATDSPSISIATRVAELWGRYRLLAQGSAISILHSPRLPSGQSGPAATLPRVFSSGRHAEPDGNVSMASGTNRLPARHVRHRRAGSGAIILRAASTTGGRR